MSKTMKLPDVPVTATGAGATLLCLDAGGNLRRLNNAGVVNLLMSTGSVLTRIALAPQDLDADQLTDNMVMYQANSDMNNGTWNGYKWENFPVSRPAGSFNLLTIRTAADRTQIFTTYSSSVVYLRTTAYNAAQGKRVWQKWVKFTGEIVGGGKTLSLNLLRNLAERRVA